MKMLQKWKIILANWINCYSEEDTSKRVSVTSKSLVNIISHLRENFNLDESTSSTLDAQTIQEFILEKYPDFRFENGNLEPKNEEETYLAASLLLYFVCVNSKDLDIKKAMCSELSAGDQEIILKFSKTLMACSDISSTDVLTAITEACGQDAATVCMGPTTVAETPPALRSLHGEVRRLQAALDAERFDRNYLQDELSRTNLKIEKLLKDKEQYKQDIVNLKAKLSTCGQDTSVNDAEASNINSVKLVKQLEQTENRLITVQEALDEVQYERDMYKSKLDELKRERDKWIATSHEETSRACQLQDELETERKHVQSLRELVTELRQHNRLNGVDTSQLECDDLDASVRSLHNASVCSEACTNVIEVQLGEERAKIVVLEQQIKLLQDQLDVVTRKSEEETQNLMKIISEKDDDIFNLKHRINEEIEEKNNLKLRYEDEVTRLNNEVNELELRIRGNGENSRRIIDSKMKEIQILQEEKLSLLQSMSDETAKLGNIIQKLTSDLDAEKTSKLKMKEDYENKVMKLNEKVLNRNNELVELQNKISENGEAIEKLQFDLRKEKESRGELIKKYNSDVTDLNMQIQAYEDLLTQRNYDIANLKEQLHECNASNEQLQKERENLRSCFAKCKEEISILEDCKAQLFINLQKRDSQIDSLQKEKEHIENEYTEEKERLQYNLDEINATVETLRNQLQNEIQYKIEIQNVLHNCELSNKNLTETINNLNERISTLKINFEEKQHALLIEREVVAELKKNCEEFDTQVQELNKEKCEKETMFQELTETVNNLKKQLTETKQRLVREKEVIAELKKTCEDQKIKIEEMNKIITEKDTLIKVFKESLDEAKIKFDEECSEKGKVIDMLTSKLTSKVNSLHDLEEKISMLHMEKDDLRKDLKDMSNHNIDLQNEMSKLSQKIKQLERTIDKLTQDIDEKTKANDNIQIKFDSERATLMTKLNVTDKSLKELQSKSNNLIDAKESQIETLKMDVEKLQMSLQQESEKSFSIEKDKTALLQHLDEANMLKNKYEKEYLNKCTLLNSISTQLNEEILRQGAVICDLKNKLEHSELDLRKEKESTGELINKYNSDFTDLNMKIQAYEDLLTQKNYDIANLKDTVETLKNQLQNEIQYKIDIQNELHNCELSNQNLTETINNLNEQISTLKINFEEKEHALLIEREVVAELKKNCKEFDTQVQELNKETCEKENTFQVLTETVNNLKKLLIETKQKLVRKKEVIAELKKTCEDQNIKIEEMNKIITEKDTLIKVVKESLDEAKIKFDEECSEKGKVIDMLTSKLTSKVNSLHDLEEKISVLHMEKDDLRKDLKDMSNHNTDLQNEISRLSQKIKQLDRTIDKLTQDIDEKTKANDNIQIKFDSERATLMTKLDVTDKSLKELQSKSNNLIDAKESQIETLKMDIEKLQMSLQQESEKSFSIEKDKTALLQHLDEANMLKNKYEKEYLNKCTLLNSISTQLNEEILRKDAVICDLKNKLEHSELDLRKEKESTGELINKYNSDFTDLNMKIQAYEDLLTQKNYDIANLKDTVETLKNQLQNEIQYKIDIQNELHNCELSNQNLTETINNLNEQISTLKINFEEKEHALLIEREVVAELKKNCKEFDTQVQELNKETCEKENTFQVLTETVNNLKKQLAETKQRLVREKEVIAELKKTCEDQNIKIEEMNKIITEKDTLIEVIKESLDEAKIKFDEECGEKGKVIDMLTSKLTSKVNSLHDLEEKICVLRMENDDLRKDLKDMSNHNIDLQNEISRLSQKIKQLERTIDKLTQDIDEKTKANDNIQLKFNSEIATLMTKLNVTDKSLKELQSKSNNLIDAKESQIETLKMDIEKLQMSLQQESEKSIPLEKDKTALLQHLDEANMLKNKYEKEYLNKCTLLNSVSTQLNEEILRKDVVIFDLKNKLEHSEKSIVDTIEEHQMKAEIELKERQKEIHTLKDEVQALKSKMELELSERDGMIEILKKEKDIIIKKFNKELIDEKECLQVKDSEIQALRRKLDEIKNDKETINILKNENEKLIKALGQRETIAVASLESPSSLQPKQLEHRDLQQQVDTTSTDYSSMESSKTITDLEKIIQDRNRTITALQSDITYLKSLVAESENKYLDTAKDLEMSKENCHQLSSQLKKIVHQKNEEIADLKKQVAKMSVTENRASQIIKVSAKYQAIILKRIAEIKSNTVLKELTNFGNTNCDTDLRKSLTAGTITMEDLENFLETTERHIRRCSEKQIALQKEKDRLAEINRINESENINIRKFLTELSVSIKTFNSVKELYTQKLSRVVSLQRTVRREILSLDGRITDAAMGSLERGYSAVMQDLYECAMNLERWIERCVSRTISPEKIKQAFSTEDERASLSSASFQNTGLEIQLEELQNSFQKLLEEVARAQKGEGAKDVQAITIMEVRAEYEDKLNRMKAKMKQLYQEQITIFKEKQNEEILRLESELKKTRAKLQECEEHIKSLTTELWTVGEKYLMKKDEADWLRKKQRSGSLMSLQHVHSSGLVPPVEERGRPSDTHSLRSLPANNNNNNNKEGRGLHMSDEEGEVFDNRWLRELAATPRRHAPPGQRLSELRYRNSLCPPHLKSSYPAETQFAPALHEEDIKCSGSMSLGGKQRKEVGITAYKKPGPPTPSKQAGRLSATDSELRESLRIEADPSAPRRTGTPSRLRALFRSNKNDTAEGTPRSRRLSNIFRKK